MSFQSYHYICNYALEFHFDYSDLWLWLERKIVYFVPIMQFTQFCDFLITLCLIKPSPNYVENSYEFLSRIYLANFCGYYVNMNSFHDFIFVLHFSLVWFYKTELSLCLKKILIQICLALLLATFLPRWGITALFDIYKSIGIVPGTWY